MTIKIYAIGKIKDFYKDGVNEYIKRISGYSKIEIIEVKDESLSDKPNELEIKKAKDNEGKTVIETLEPSPDTPDLVRMLLEAGATGTPQPCWDIEMFYEE